MVLNATIATSGKESTDGASERDLHPMKLWPWVLQYGYTAYFEVKLDFYNTLKILLLCLK